jgi:hypothetical protein
VSTAGRYHWLHIRFWKEKRNLCKSFYVAVQAQQWFDSPLELRSIPQKQPFNLLQWNIRQCRVNVPLLTVRMSALYYRHCIIDIVLSTLYYRHYNSSPNPKVHSTLFFIWQSCWVFGWDLSRPITKSIDMS